LYLALIHRSAWRGVLRTSPRRGSRNSGTDRGWPRSNSVGSQRRVLSTGVAPSTMGPGVGVRQFTKAAGTLPSCCQDLTQGACTSHILPPFAERKLPDREVIENMPHDGHNSHNDVLSALYTLLAGPRGAGRPQGAPSSPATTSSRTSCAGPTRGSSRKPGGCSPRGSLSKRTRERR
jgi:hypothetical protein